MLAKDIKREYIEFFKAKGHRQINGAPLRPENDPTVLFTTAGMHPLVPYLLGEPHPAGKRLVDVQKCLRTDDIDEVGDASHLTFFEMLGNWSLGDYWKEEAIKWSFEFLTQKLHVDKKKLFVTVFAGDSDAPRDEESAKIWMSLGIPKERIFFLPKKDNWWGPAGETGPCGPDTEMFVDTGKTPHGPDCIPGCHCGKYFEVWNDVFMQYNKTADGKYIPLKQKNVDTGMGVERMAAMLQGKSNVYETEMFRPIIEKIKEISELENRQHKAKYITTDIITSAVVKSYEQELSQRDEKSMRIIADHVRAAVFILLEGIVPSNVDQGYILRRLIRRSIRHGKLLGIENDFMHNVADAVVEVYNGYYPELVGKKEFILGEMQKEETRFRSTLSQGIKRLEEIIVHEKHIDGKNAFLLFQSFGFPIEMTKEFAKDVNVTVDEAGFAEEFKKHQELSRVGAEKKFKGGLSDASEQSTKLHTATHLLNEALRQVLGKQIVQRGSNITPERLRFDFNFDRKLTEQELKDVERIVNEKIAEGLTVERKEMSVEEAKKLGAQAMFEQKYSEFVSVYAIGKFSVEICGGPHVKNTKELGKFKIVKEEAVAAGVRRIKAIVE